MRNAGLLMVPVIPMSFMLLLSYRETCKRAHAIKSQRAARQPLNALDVWGLGEAEFYNAASLTGHLFALESRDSFATMQLQRIPGRELSKRVTVFSCTYKPTLAFRFVLQIGDGYYLIRKHESRELVGST